MCPLYVAGLIGPGDRKSVQPMAERLAPGDYDQLHHFVAAGVWDAAPLETELLIQADRLVGGSDAVLVIDDTAVPQLKEELGLDHFEGRSWHGLHRHALMAMIAYAFLQHRRLKKVRRGKKNQRPAPPTDVAGGSPRHRRPHHAIKSSAMSVLPILDQRGKAA